MRIRKRPSGILNRQLVFLVKRFDYLFAVLDSFRQIFFLDFADFAKLHLEILNVIYQEFVPVVLRFKAFDVAQLLLCENFLDILPGIQPDIARSG